LYAPTAWAQNIPFGESAHDPKVDQIFPWERQGDNDVRSHPLVRIIARFTPSFSPVSHLSIRVTETGATIEYAKATDRDLTRIRRAESKLDKSQTDKFMDTFWENLGKSAESIKKELGMIALDGTNYEVRVTASLASLTYIVRDEEASEVVTGQGVIRWLNVIRLDMEKRLPK
jgi:hypothetical protein